MGLFSRPFDSTFCFGRLDMPFSLCGEDIWLIFLLMTARKDFFLVRQGGGGCFGVTCAYPWTFLIHIRQTQIDIPTELVHSSLLAVSMEVMTD